MSTFLAPLTLTLTSISDPKVSPAKIRLPERNRSHLKNNFSVMSLGTQAKVSTRTPEETTTQALSQAVYKFTLLYGGECFTGN